MDVPLLQQRGIDVVGYTKIISNLYRYIRGGHLKKKIKKPGRPPGSVKRKTPVKFQCEMDPELKKWLRVQVKKKVFRNMTHGVEYCLSVMKNVFDQREEQIEALAKSHPLGVIINDIDSKVAGANHE